MLGQRSVEDFLHRPEYELYNLANDPNEISNLTDDASHQTVKQTLIKRLEAFQETTRDPWRRELVSEKAGK